MGSGTVWLQVLPAKCGDERNPDVRATTAERIPVCHHLVAINYVRGKEVQRCFCGARQSSTGGGDATLLALRQYDKRRVELNER
jgi:hypothetical protein